MADQSQSKGLLILAIVVLVAVLGYVFLNKPDDRNGVQKLGDAIHELPNGPDKAARELKDRTPADRISDAVKDETDKTRNP